MAAAKKKYRVLIGINYPDGDGGEIRAEPGDLVSDIPERSIHGLVKTGAIEDAATKHPKKSEDEEA